MGDTVKKRKPRRRRCKAKTKAGKACRATPRRDTGLCNAHSSKEVQVSAGFGGSQPGAGRPRAPRVVDVIRERIEADVELVITPLVEALEADRPELLFHGTDGEPSEYERVPDWKNRITAARELLDRAYGKARIALEHTGPDGGPVQVDAAGPDLTSPKVRELLNAALAASAEAERARD